jgi:hypothetical protein
LAAGEGQIGETFMTTVIEAVFENGVFRPLAEAELRAGLQTFAEDWESEEMSIYDDYDAARSRL